MKVLDRLVNLLFSSSKSVVTFDDINRRLGQLGDDGTLDALEVNGLPNPATVLLHSVRREEWALNDLKDWMGWGEYKLAMADLKPDETKALKRCLTIAKKAADGRLV